ncbi:hypothetical protein JCM30471_35490 [Desulfuromonas carbonis]|uniref:hypothetical protein n=1 Tax=Desulfuromonas sp. DDH964 TaxID=1823759 RepID=UPI0012F98792|nr:hypothetical protein [Desulfuromonas sp. DDH964]
MKRVPLASRWLPVLMALLLLSAPPAWADFDLHVNLAATDPGEGGTLAVEQQLYMKVDYRSDIPLVFAYSAYSQGEKLEADFYSGYPQLQSAGEHEALGWIGFSSPTQIDELRVEILDANRQKIGEIAKPFTFFWKQTAAATGERPKAAWVSQLERYEERQRTLTVDPFEQRRRNLDGLLFGLDFVSIPLYLLLQGYTLWRFRGRWRDLAAIPLVSLVPLVLASLVGFGMELRYWVVFIFRGTPFALAYLIAVWLGYRRMRKLGMGRNEGVAN